MTDVTNSKPVRILTIDEVAQAIFDLTGGMDQDTTCLLNQAKSILLLIQIYLSKLGVRDETSSTLYWERRNLSQPFKDLMDVKRRAAYTPEVQAWFSHHEDELEQIAQIIKWLSLAKGLSASWQEKTLLDLQEAVAKKKVALPDVFVLGRVTLREFMSMVDETDIDPDHPDGLEGGFGRPD